MEDILYQIGSYLSTSELNIFARVSSATHKCAAGRLYKIVSLREAVAPLGEVQKRNGYYEFVHPITERGWDRFLWYADYVQVLTGGEQYLPIVEVLLGKAVTKGMPYLFPRIRYLEWTTLSEKGLETIQVFMAPNLTRLSLRLHSLPAIEFHRLCVYLIQYIETIDLLQIDLPNDTQLEDQCHRLLACLLKYYAPKLTSVCIPTTFNTPHVATALASLPNLRKALVGFAPSTLPDLRSLRRKMVDSILPAGLEFLDTEANNRNLITSREFHYVGTSETLNRIYLPSFKSFKTTTITSFIWILESALKNMKQFIPALILVCPQLKELSLGSSSMYDHEEVEEEEEEDTVIPVESWITIEPLIRLRTLTCLSIHCAKIAMTSTELQALCQSRNTWEVFEVFPSKPVDLPEIFKYMNHCQQLRKLGIFTDIDSDNDPARLQLPPNFVKFPALHKLVLAYSGIDRDCEEMIGRFLYSASQKPVVVEGWYLVTCIGIRRQIAYLYEEDARRTGIQLPFHVQRYLEHVESDEKSIANLPYHWQEDDDMDSMEGDELDDVMGDD